MVVSISQRKLRAETLQFTTWHSIWQFQTPAQKRYFQMHLLAERFVCWRWWSRFSTRGSQDLSNGTKVASWLANLFSVIRSIVYDPCWLENHPLAHSCLALLHFNIPFPSLCCTTSLWCPCNKTLFWSFLMFFVSGDVGHTGQWRRCCRMRSAG